MRAMILLATAGLLAAGPAFAQSAKENFSYSAPSGMFSEGTTKWQNYRFQFEDAERTARLRAGEPTATGSVQGAATNTETYRRPGETNRRRYR
jgi:hypothetical protein